MKHLCLAVFALLTFTLPLAGKPANFSAPTTLLASNRIQGLDRRPIVIAGIFKWIDELVSSGRKVRIPRASNVPIQAHRYAEQQDRSGGDKGFFYFLCLGVWRLAAALGAAFLAGKAMSKRNVSSDVKNLAYLMPFTLGLFFPIFTIFAAGITWLACSEQQEKHPES